MKKSAVRWLAAAAVLLLAVMAVPVLTGASEPALAARTGWYEVWNDENGCWEWIYYDRYGDICYGWTEFDDGWRYFDDETGYQETGWVRFSEGQWAYFDPTTGLQVFGWQKIGGEWFYFDTDYYAGYQVFGWQKIGGIWYYFDPTDDYGNMVTGFVHIGGENYYFDESGTMRTGWVMVDGHWRYYMPDGSAADGWVCSGGKWYYLDGSFMRTGWLCDPADEVCYYLDDTTGAMRTGWVWMRERNAWGYFAANGAGYTGWVRSGTDWYYISNGMACCDGPCRIGGQTYLFDENGIMATGWVYDEILDCWSYYGEDGAMRTGWFYDGEAGCWRYFADNGAMYRNGVFMIDGDEYYFDEHGACYFI